MRARDPSRRFAVSGRMGKLHTNVIGFDDAPFARDRGADRKWRLIQRAGPLDPIRGILVQRVGISIDHTRELLAATTLHGNLPEPLRLAHLIAGGVTTGAS